MTVTDDRLIDVAPRETSRCMRWSLLFAVGGAIGLILSVVLAPQQFFAAYLATYLWCLNIALGSTVILMTYHLTGGAWGFLIRRILEAASRTLPLVAIGFVPIALGAARLYLWAQPDAVAGNKLLQEQQIYMNLPFWCARAAIYFGLWLLTAFLLNVFSRREDRTGSPSMHLWLNGISGIGLVIYGISIHFASVDWIISLQPAYHSTITGPLLASQQLLCALSLAGIVFGECCAGGSRLRQLYRPRR